ncbi:YciI family protein [Roseateles sp. BYS96W]|uniref:YciI family protein n=1 Tax=Pelomonas nitida TaxID=3299027 RepID=A0ABW7G7Y5_9BURK
MGESTQAAPLNHDFSALTTNAHEDWTLFAVRFHDKPGAAELHRQLLQAHLEWVAAHQDVVRAAGSLRESPEATPVGGLWVLRAPDKAAVEALIATDPFTTGGLRAGWDIFYWSKALPQAVSF